MDSYLCKEFGLWDIIKKTTDPALEPLANFSQFIKLEENGNISLNLNPILKKNKLKKEQIPQSILESQHYEVELSNNYLNLNFDNSFFNNMILSNLYKLQELPFWKNIGENKVVCIDFSSPNIAKNLGFHHIRSTVTGNFLSKIYEKVGYDVKKLNFLGDWGSGVCKLIFGYEYFNYSDAQIGPWCGMDIDSLHKLYVRISQEIKEKPELQKQVSVIERILEDGNNEKYIRLWCSFKEITLKELKKLYKYFDITFDDYNGESFFAKNKQLINLIKNKLSNKLKISDTGSQYIQIPKIKEPCYLFKSNGETIYTTRDLAAIKYRYDTYNFNKILYVVDSGQNLHFKKVFGAVKLIDSDIKNMEHLDFGQVLMFDEEEKTWTKGSSRDGKTFRLIDIINLLVKKQKEKTEFYESNDMIYITKQGKKLTQFTKEEFENNIIKIALSGLIFDTLRIKRRTNIKFNLDKILNIEGDTGPYILYNLVRIKSINRKFIEKFGELNEENINFKLLKHNKEKELVIYILNCEKIIQTSIRKNESCCLAEYVIKLCKKLASYYSVGKIKDSMKVISDDIILSSTRLALLNLIQKIIIDILDVFGIKSVDYM